MAEGKRMTADEVVSYLLEEEEGVDFLPESLKWVVQQLMEVEVSELIGARLGERTADRATYRNGYRARRWDTRAGEIELAIPKLRRGSYFPTFLEPRRRSEQALVAVVQEAYVAGVSTRKVDQVVESLGLRVSKSEVSRVCQGLDEQVEAFRCRPLEGRYPYLWLDAKVERVRDGGRVRRKCLVIAHAVHESGRREVIGMDVGECETEPFWTSFRRELVRRGLTGVQLAVSDAHEGLKAAIAKVLGCPWQRCTVHFLRDCLGHARREQQPMLAALIRPIFSAEDREQARERLSEAVAATEDRLPKVAALLEPRRTCSPSTPSRPTTGARSARPTRSSGSTARSAGAPTSSASFPTTARCCGSPPAWRSSKTMSGSSGGATCRPARWSRSSRSGSIAPTNRRCESSSRPEEPQPLPTISYTTSWDLTALLVGGLALAVVVRAQTGARAWCRPEGTCWPTACSTETRPWARRAGGRSSVVGGGGTAQRTGARRNSLGSPSRGKSGR
jgi:putative transposase